MKYAVYPYTVENQYVSRKGEADRNIVTCIVPGGLPDDLSWNHEVPVCTMEDVIKSSALPFDKVIILDSNVIHYEEYEKTVEIFIKKGIGIVLSTNIYDAMLLDKYRGRNTDIIDIQDLKTAQHRIVLENNVMKVKKEINVPVISVMGIGYHVSKFDVQLYLRKYFLKHGYRVAQIGSKKISALFGFYSVPDFMFHSQYSNADKIFRFNEFVKKIEVLEKPDVIIIGVPEPILPLNKKHPFSFGICAYEMLNAVDTDYNILMLMNGDYSEEFESEMRNVCKYRYNVELDDFVVSDFTIISNSLYSSELKYAYTGNHGHKTEREHFWSMHSLEEETLFCEIEKKLKRYGIFEQY